MTAPRHASADPMGKRLFVVEGGRLIPPICPHCGAPGTTEEAIPHVLAAATRHIEPLHVHLCDLCAEQAARVRTLRFAWITGATILGLGLATASSFVFGERFEVAQAWGVALFAVALAFAAGRASWSRPPGVWEVTPQAGGRSDRGEPSGRSEPAERLLWSRSPPFDQALRERDWPETALPPVLPRPTPYTWLGRIGPLYLIAPAAAMLWWTSLHLFFRANVRVVNMGPGPVSLLIDQRRQANLGAMRFEQPELGLFTQVIAGPRHVLLMGMDGSVLYDARVTLYPGQTLLVTRLLPQFCTYKERFDYARPERPEEYSILTRGTEAVVVRDSVDSWFAPLSADGSEIAPHPALPDGVALAEGIRTAVRLFACN